MLGKRLQKLIERATGIAIILLAAGASEARPISPSQLILSSLEGSSTVANSTSTLNLPERGVGIEIPLLAQAQQPRTALVIGNADYEDDPLENPTNDATAIYETLKDLGFDVPPPLLNANKQEMIDAIRQFQDRLEEGGVGVFYYSGHGVQVNGANYLIPLEADLEREAEVEFEAVDLERVISSMNDAGTLFNVLIIDACRDNPFYKRWRSTRGSSPQGLTLTSPPRGTLIAYATEPNDVAEDGTGNQNSPYTQSLLRHLPTPGISIWDMLTAVGTDVYEATNGSQSPYVEGTPSGYFSFNPTTELEIPAASSQPGDNPPTPDLQQPELTASQTQRPNPTNTSSVNFPSSTATSPAQQTQSQNQTQESSGSQSQSQNQTQESSGSQSQLQTQSQGPQAQALQPNLTTSADEPTLISSATGVNYQPLRDALTAGNFREANEITRSLMLQSVGRESEGYLLDNDLRNFSCEDFRIIDQLWQNYSSDKFGFSVQQEIYQNLAGTSNYSEDVWMNYGDQVGWRENDQWLHYSDIDFNISAPRGHLPIHRLGLGVGFLTAEGMLSLPPWVRHMNCNINSFNRS